MCGLSVHVVHLHLMSLMSLVVALTVLVLVVALDVLILVVALAVLLILVMLNGVGSSGVNGSGRVRWSVIVEVVLVWGVVDLSWISETIVAVLLLLWMMLLRVDHVLNA